MKKLLLLPLVIAFALTANAQFVNKPAFSLGGELGIPNYGLYNVVLAASGKLEFPIVSPVSISLTGGFSTVFKRSSVFANQTGGADLYAPLKAGVKYYVSQNVFLEGEGGVAIGLNNAKRTLGLFSIGPGFVIPSGTLGIEIGLRYEDWQGQLKQTAIRVAYRFGL